MPKSVLQCRNPPNDCTVKQLRDLLHNAGLKRTGLKAELIARYNRYLTDRTIEPTTKPKAAPKSKTVQKPKAAPKPSPSVVERNLVLKRRRDLLLREAEREAHRAYNKMFETTVECNNLASGKTELLQEALKHGCDGFDASKRFGLDLVLEAKIKQGKSNDDENLQYTKYYCKNFQRGDLTPIQLKSIVKDISTIVSSLKNCVQKSNQLIKEYKSFQQKANILARHRKYGPQILKAYTMAKSKVKTQNQVRLAVRRLLQYNQVSDRPFANDILSIKRPWRLYVARQKSQFKDWLRSNGPLKFANIMSYHLEAIPSLINTVYKNGGEILQKSGKFPRYQLYLYKFSEEENLSNAPYLLGITNDKDDKSSIKLSKSDAKRMRLNNINLIEKIKRWLSKNEGPNIAALPITISRGLKTVSHANILILNRSTRTGVYFEPHGTYYSNDYHRDKTFMIKAFGASFGMNIVFPRINYELQESLGWCVSWCCYFAFTYVLNSSLGILVNEALSFNDLLRFMYFLKDIQIVKGKTLETYFKYPDRYEILTEDEKLMYSLRLKEEGVIVRESKAFSGVYATAGQRNLLK